MRQNQRLLMYSPSSVVAVRLCDIALMGVWLIVDHPMTRFQVLETPCYINYLTVKKFPCIFCTPLCRLRHTGCGVSLTLQLPRTGSAGWSGSTHPSTKWFFPFSLKRARVPAPQRTLLRLLRAAVLSNGACILLRCAIEERGILPVTQLCLE